LLLKQQLKLLVITDRGSSLEEDCSGLFIQWFALSWFQSLNSWAVAHQVPLSMGFSKQDYLQVGDNEKAGWFTVMIQDRKGYFEEKTKDMK